MPEFNCCLRRVLHRLLFDFTPVASSLWFIVWLAARSMRRGTTLQTDLNQMPSSLWNASLILLWYYDELICTRDWSFFIQVFPDDYLLFVSEDKYHYLAVTFKERLSAKHKEFALEPTMSLGFTADVGLQSSLTLCNRWSSILWQSG